MAEPLTLNSDLKKLIHSKVRIPIGLTIGFALFLMLIVYLATIIEITYIALGIIAFIPVIFLLLRYPRIWIYTIAVTNAYFLLARGKDVSAIEIGIAFLYLGSIFFWFFWEVFVNRKKIVRNIADLSLLFFTFFLVLNVFVAYLNGVNILYWARESVNLLLILLYFPIRKYFTDKKQIVTLLMIYLVVVIFLSAYNYYTYWKALHTNLVYAYQLVQDLRINQTLFTAASAFGIIFALYQKSLWKSILLLIFTGISTAGLISSFSRTFWVILLIEVFIMFFYLVRKQKVKLILYTFISTLLILGTMLFVFQDKADLMLSLIEKRFESTGQGTKDASVIARLDEYQKVWKGIKEYPIGGNGMGKEFDFWSFLENSTRRTRIIHNGYLFFMYKTGIPLTLVFIFPFFYYLIVSEKLSRKTKNEFFRLLSLGSFLAVFLLIISNFTSTQFISRESVFVTALVFAFINVVTEKNLKINNKLNSLNAK